MSTEWLYFAVTLAIAVAVAASVLVVSWSNARSDGTLTGGRARWIPLLGTVVLLAVVAIALRITAVAEADGRVIERLAAARTSGLDDAFSLVTRIGDVVPTYTIAASLAVALVVSGRRIVTVWLLPLLVAVQLALQFFLADHVFESLTIDVIEPSVPLGGAGSNPSGATARLLALFLVAATICRVDHPRASRVLTVVAAVATVVEVVSRLYLGRHLAGDIVGGLGLGVALAIVANAIVMALEPFEARLADRLRW